MKMAVAGPVIAQNIPCVLNESLTGSIAAYLIPQVQCQRVSPFLRAMNARHFWGPTEEKNPSGKNSDVTSVNIDIVFACRSINSFAPFSASLAVLLSTNFFT